MLPITAKIAEGFFVFTIDNEIIFCLDTCNDVMLGNASQAEYYKFIGKFIDIENLQDVIDNFDEIYKCRIEDNTGAEYYHIYAFTAY